MKEVAQTFETQAIKLVNTPQGVDFIAIMIQFGKVGKSCKACHTQFRTRLAPWICQYVNSQADQPFVKPEPYRKRS